MKIALCFHGLPRLVNQCYKDISEYFITDTRNKGSTLDIYAHFWYDESHNNKVNRLHVPETYPVDENPIEIFNKLYNELRNIGSLKTSSLSNTPELGNTLLTNTEVLGNTQYNNVIYEDCPVGFDSNLYRIQGYNTEDIKNDNLYSKIMASFVLYGLWSRFLSATKVLELMDNINKDKSDYDLVIISRTDLLTFNKGKHIIDEIANLNFTDTIYFPSTLEGGIKYAGEHPNHLGDWLFMGTPYNIKKYCNTIISSLCTSQPSQSICPLHNTERLKYWATLANIILEKFNSTISIRRFPTEEWENPDYRASRMISPKFYTDNFDTTKGCYNTNARDLLPFYTDNIKFIK